MNHSRIGGRIQDLDANVLSDLTIKNFNRDKIRHKEIITENVKDIVNLFNYNFVNICAKYANVNYKNVQVVRIDGASVRNGIQHRKNKNVIYLE